MVDTMIFFISFIVALIGFFYIQNHRKIKNEFIDRKIPSSPNIDFFVQDDLHNQDYLELLTRRPNYFDYVDGSYEYAYTDSYKTNEGYKLRELLLLVWWGKIKKGRTSNAKVPRYFYDRYHINPNNVTKQFFIDNLIYVDSGNIVRFTDRGKTLFQKYQDLWEIHSLKEYYGNLDRDFPFWDLDSFLIKKHTQNIIYLKEMAQFHKVLADYFIKNYPKDEDNINYNQDQVIYYLEKINTLNNVIDALKG